VVKESELSALKVGIFIKTVPEEDKQRAADLKKQIGKLEVR
jgi:hypothetical protein